ncbi:PhzF family phenazine biosynthesis protein [Chitinophaga ginsengisoli]|uniref:PhzF family phenazine biosynthesis protein n=1 Tax=Chitinophaga ginsengisoli TaxID=363837 RepID=A0A2P8GPL6_9BACT|nr:PhzF family phenazine biosynthesis protein [Chitinophaga ginsengisoli]PSL35894.1 PhzF family phenazine biosynthesis protein [Chitinophaga ginsengisoli]
MTELDLYQVDAFTDHVFGGNPACVVPLETWLPDEQLLLLARENAVAETAFFIPEGDGFSLRWFTPEIEMDLCGHATLATAHVIKTILGYKKDKILFSSASGPLEVSFKGDLYVLDFPSRKPVEAVLPDVIRRALDRQPLAVLKARDYVLVYGAESDIRDIRIDRQVLDQINLDPGGVIVTAQGTDCDFVSRFFTPQASILEDPVTGSAHCSLIPYWSERLQKQELTARQLSERVGTLYCTDMEERVLIAGNACTYSAGKCWI